MFSLFHLQDETYDWGNACVLRDGVHGEVRFGVQR